MNKEVVRQTKKKRSGYKKIPTPGPGRPKGAKDKISRTAKQNIEKVIEELGGYKGILKWANKNSRNQGLLYSWYFKLLPSNIKAELSERNVLNIKFVPVKKKKKDDDEGV